MEQKENVHSGHRQRLKERFREVGIDGLSDINCLELLLFYAIPRKDTNPLAHALLDRFGSLSAVFSAPPEQLQQVPGISEHAATLLYAIPQLARRYMVDQANTTTILNTTTRCGEYLLPRFFGAREELVFLLCLDAKCKVLDCRQIAKGSVNAADISARKIIETALAVNATSVVIAHNHTSGLALPSREDEMTTRRLDLALDAVGIQLIDHIIVADNDFVSMNDSGFFRYR